MGDRGRRATVQGGTDGGRWVTYLNEIDLKFELVHDYDSKTVLNSVIEYDFIGVYTAGAKGGVFYGSERRNRQRGGRCALAWLRTTRWGWRTGYVILFYAESMYVHTLILF